MKEKKTILIVDDNQDFLGLYSAAFRRVPHFEVLSAHDGLEAKTLLETKEIDLLITDLRMPRMNGFELIRWCRQYKNVQRLPAILITGEDIGPRDLEVEKLSEDALLLRKPVELDKLRRIVSDMIEI